MATIDILLVDDSEGLALLARKALESRGLAGRMVWCKSAELASHLLFDDIDGCGAASKPRLVIVDAEMPGVDGYDLLRRIRRHPATAMVPVVMCTVGNSADDIRRAYAAGANAFLSKSSDAIALMRDLAETASYWTRTNAVLH